MLPAAAAAEADALRLARYALRRCDAVCSLLQRLATVRRWLAVVSVVCSCSLAVRLQGRMMSPQRQHAAMNECTAQLNAIVVMPSHPARNAVGAPLSPTAICITADSRYSGDGAGVWPHPAPSHVSRQPGDCRQPGVLPMACADAMESMVSAR